jgi:hypothetical protein
MWATFLGAHFKTCVFKTSAFSCIARYAYQYTYNYVHMYICSNQKPDVFEWLMDP